MGEVAGRSDTAFAATVGTAAMPAVVNYANINIQPANIFFMITSSKRGAEVGNSGTLLLGLISPLLIQSANIATSSSAYVTAVIAIAFLMASCGALLMRVRTAVELGNLSKLHLVIQIWKCG